MGDDKANIYVARNGKSYGPYSVGTINEYLASGELLVDDLGWSEDIGYYTLSVLERPLSTIGDGTRKMWIRLDEIEGVRVPDRMPPPPILTNKEDDDPSDSIGCGGLISFFFPLAGLFLWAVYIGSKPNKAKMIGKCALWGLAIGLGLLFIIGIAGS